jgi:CRP-like cAMP-binding protein
MLQPSSSNRLLERIVQRDKLLTSNVVSLPLEAGTVLNRRGEVVTSFYFPLDGIMAVDCDTGGGRGSQVALIGDEGMSGIDRVLVDTFASFDTWALTAMHVAMVPVGRLIEAQQRDGVIAQMLLAYARAYSVQLATNTASAVGYVLRVRTARWILMASDRLGMEFGITHALIARCLSTRRAGVTTMLQTLEGEGILVSTRAHLKILDRAALSHIAGASYGFAETEYDRYLGP